MIMLRGNVLSHMQGATTLEQEERKRRESRQRLEQYTWKRSRRKHRTKTREGRVVIVRHTQRGGNTHSKSGAEGNEDRNGKTAEKEAHKLQRVRTLMTNRQIISMTRDCLCSVMPTIGRVVLIPQFQ